MLSRSTPRHTCRGHMAETTESSSPLQDKTFAEFLQTTPPEVADEVADLVYNAQRLYLAEPPLQLHCSVCDGVRWFDKNECSLYPEQGRWKDGILAYLCRNCKKVIKRYALTVHAVAGKQSGKAYKFGEFPQFGDPLPTRIFTLVGPDKELFLQGRRSENRGFGIGSLTYYRRVVEEQWERIVIEIRKVAEKVGASPQIISTLNDVAKHTQFGRAVDSVKPAVPQVLLINGHNPLTLLHTALSEAVHDKSDQECLEIAQDIRTVLAELAERIGQALKDTAELKSAVARLQSRGEKGTSKQPELKSSNEKKADSSLRSE